MTDIPSVLRPAWQSAVLSLAERVLATYVEAFLGLLVLSGPLDLGLAQVAAVAALPAALSVLSNSLTALAVPVGLPFAADLAVRAGKTAVQTFLGFVLAAPVFGLDRSLLTAAFAATVPAVLAVVKAGVASRVGNTSTAAFLPVSVDPAPVERVGSPSLERAVRARQAVPPSPGRTRE